MTEYFNKNFTLCKNVLTRMPCKVFVCEFYLESSSGIAHLLNCERREKKDVVNNENNKKKKAIHVKLQIAASVLNQLQITTEF